MQCLCGWEKGQGTERGYPLPAATRTQSHDPGLKRTPHSIGEERQAIDPSVWPRLQSIPCLAT